MSFDLRVESRFKNALLFRALDELLGPGWTNQKAAEVLGVDAGTFGSLLRLKRDPKRTSTSRLRKSRTAWCTAAAKISENLGYSPEELFPDSLYALRLPDVVFRDYSSPELLSLQEASKAGLLEPASIDVDTDMIDIRRGLEEALSSLDNQRERKVLELRFGLADGEEHTLDEVGYYFGVSRGRIQQIEAKAIRKLRHPSRSVKLSPIVRHRRGE